MSTEDEIRILNRHELPARQLVEEPVYRAAVYETPDDAYSKFLQKQQTKKRLLYIWLDIVAILFAYLIVGAAWAWLFLRLSIDGFRMGNSWHVLGVALVIGLVATVPVYYVSYLFRFTLRLILKR